MPTNPPKGVKKSKAHVANEPSSMSIQTELSKKVYATPGANCFAMHTGNLLIKKGSYGSISNLLSMEVEKHD